MPLAVDINITPNKRKRESGRFNSNGLPIISAPQPPPPPPPTQPPDANKENRYAYNAFMEVKSLSDLVLPERSLDNPFEVLRKPPKKKKKQDFEDSCFTNPALNLNGPEHILNPYEIKRPVALHPPPASSQLCFVNTGLNIRVPEKEQRNPFEVVRHPVNSTAFENAGMEQPQQQSISRAIAVPFTPTIGCRINFNDIPLESLTPCSMLANKLVLNSPVVELTPQKPPPVTAEHMSVISEESLVVDINEELDCYQLELENSINEAKLVKKNRRSSGRKRNLMDLKNIQTFAARLNTPDEYMAISEVETDTEVADRHGVQEPSPLPVLPIALSSDVEFKEVAADTSDDEFQFKNPTPFVRTFRRKSSRKAVVMAAAELSEQPTANQKSVATGIRSSFRKSMRKLMHGGQQKKVATVEQLGGEEPAAALSGNLFSTIRQSLRRKAAPKLLESTDEESSHEISIMVESARPVFKQVIGNRLNHAGVTAAGRDDDDVGSLLKRKTSLRSSFRKSTKDVQRQVMKSMFNRNVEEYQFQ